jgi:hypothetical protein
MKAYVVGENYEGHCEVVFAEKRGAAKAQGANALGIDFTEITSCRRTPSLDQYAPGPVPIKVLIEDGWRFEARDGDYVSSDYEDMFFTRDGQDVYRSWMGWLDERVADALEKKHMADCIAACLKLFPFAMDIYTASYSDGLSCLFRWPGGEDTVRWRVGDDNVWVTKREQAAWEAFRARGYTP